ncbi:MAG: BatA domain-containing protein [Planctomycetaceae bacterium]
MAWFASYFFNPAFVAGGAALVAAPIIIHLINRMRYRRVRFAAMEFLLASKQRNRRRILIEQLLLLLLRILIVLAIVALIARLILDSKTLAALGNNRAQHVVLLDDSGSMRDRWDETTAFDEALSVVEKLVAEGARRPNTQQFTLILLSNPEQPIFSQEDVDDELLRKANAELTKLKGRATHRALDLAVGLDAARQHLADEKAVSRHLHLVSDFRRKDWTSQRAVAEVIATMDDSGVTVNLVRTVPERHANLAVTAVTGDFHIATVGFDHRVGVTVRNFGDAKASNVPVSLFLNGEKLPQGIQVDAIEPGSETTVEKYINFDKAGPNRLEARLDPDALPHDNSRFVAVDVKQATQVLVIDGDPAGRLAEAYVQTVFDPQFNATDSVVASVDYLRRQPLDHFTSILMVNVASLPPDALAPLEDYVRSGGGLVWFMGDTVQRRFYNETLYAEGKGLFPVPLGSTHRELPPKPEGSTTPDLDVDRHPIFFNLFDRDDGRALLIDIIGVSRFFPVAEGWQRDDNRRQDGVRTFGRLRTGDPVFFEHRYGEGRVITFLSTAAPQWNDWARTRSYPILMLEAVRHTAFRDARAERRTVGVPIQIELDAANYVEDVQVIVPGPQGDRTFPIKATLASAAAGGTGQPGTDDGDGDGDEDAERRTAGQARYTVSFPEQGRVGGPDTDHPGIYVARYFDQKQVPEERLFAYNVPVEEGDLSIADDDAIRAQLGPAVRVQIQAPGTVAWIEGEEPGQEVRRWLLIGLIVFLLCEQLMAYRLSYHPRMAGAGAAA